MKVGEESQRQAREMAAVTQPRALTSALSLGSRQQAGDGLMISPPHTHPKSW